VPDVLVSGKVGKESVQGLSEIKAALKVNANEKMSTDGGGRL